MQMLSCESMNREKCRAWFHGWSSGVRACIQLFDEDSDESLYEQVRRLNELIYDELLYLLEDYEVPVKNTGDLWVLMHEAYGTSMWEAFQRRGARKRNKRKSNKQNSKHSK
jgi:hypothetical protein